MLKPVLCSFFGAKLVKNVITKESPEWLRNHLLASGIKPINNIVDISNYVMLETGQPIHMYDYDKLKEKSFVIKTGFDTKKRYWMVMNMNFYQKILLFQQYNGIGCVAGVMVEMIQKSTKIL